MSVVQAMKRERSVWRSAWQQVETFLDRLGSAKDDDGAHAAAMSAMLAVLDALERERLYRVGLGLRAQQAMSSVVSSQLDECLPGAVDVELAVAPPALLVGDLPLQVMLAPSAEMFSRYDDDRRQWVPIRVPDYGVSVGAAVLVPIDKTSLFTMANRTDAVREGHVDLTPWSAVRQRRLASRPLSPVIVDSPDATERSQAVAQAISACDAGRAALSAGRDALAAAGLDGAVISGLDGELSQRRQIYLTLQAQPSQMGSEVRARLARTQKLDAFDAAASVEVDEAIKSRVAYPDGTLRILRTIEWTFAYFWKARVPWFSYRRARFLQPLFTEALEPFVRTLSRLLAHQPLQAPLTATLAVPAAQTATTLTLASRPAGPYDLGALVPGQALAVGGARRSVAIVLGEGDPDSAGRQRVRIWPLRVSLLGGAEAPGVPGLVEAGAPLGSGPAQEVAEAMLLRGQAGAHPEHDAVPEQVIGLWSRLCLLLGTTAVQSALAQGGQAVPALSPLPSASHVPVLGTLAPRAQELVIDASTVSSEAPFARPGELLLLRGTAGGATRQGVVEVIELVRTSAAAIARGDAITAQPLTRSPCDGPGDRFVLRVKDTPFTEPLETVRLHRQFQGFGAPSLATGRVLPAAVDPASAGASSLDRLAELDAACRLIEDWFGP